MIDIKSTYRLNVLIAIVITFLLFSCRTDDNPIDNSPQSYLIKIAVFSDPHLFDPTLGIYGSAFDEYISFDRKIIAESYAITESIVNSLLIEKPDIVLVSGDLTKDGEMKSHKLFAFMMKKIIDAGIKICVIPGNHDINNSNSYSYSGANKTRVPNINDIDFSSIYSDCGFSSAIYRDTNSLSYISEPKQNIWVLAIDACKYKDVSLTSGALSVETMNWIQDKLIEAKSKNKTVIGMMHHGIIEHFSGQEKLMSQYLIDDYQNVSEQLAKAGLRIMFTGHFHANDIVKKEIGNDFIFDIETGSSVTSPCPYRIVTLTNDEKFDIKTKYVTSINYDLKGATDFQTYAYNYLKNGLGPTVSSLLKTYGNITDQQISLVSPLVVSALMAHYAGDENPDDQTKSFIQSLQENPQSKLFGDALSGFWTDLAPRDNNIIIDLKTGVISK